jgi:uncharacterized protein (TIGR00369 family)
LAPVDVEPATETEVWREPVRGGYPDPGVIGLDGLERLRLWRVQRLPAPPLHHLTGATPTRFGEGTAEAEMPASGWLCNPAGVIGGGTLAILADIAFGCSLESVLPAATPYTTAELSLTFLRPAHPGKQPAPGQPADVTLTAAGQAIHSGRSVGLSEVFVIEGDADRLIAHGTSRLSVLPTIDPPPEPPPELPTLEPPAAASPDPYLRSPPETALPQETWSELSGAEILARQIRGELPPPPIHYLTGLRPVEAGDGAVTAVMPASEWLASPTRLLQGGTVAMLADTAMMMAVLTKAAAGTAVAGLDLKINYLRPAPPDGRDLTAEAMVEHSGRTLAISRARISNADGKAVALATGSAMYLPDRAASLGPEVELSGG